MAKLIKINESQLKNIISESIQQVLKEESYCWWGDTKPLEKIRSFANEIANKYTFNDDDWDESDRAAFDLMKWAERVAYEAERFIHCNATNMPINGGEDW